LSGLSSNGHPTFGVPVLIAKKIIIVIDIVVIVIGVIILSGVVIVEVFVCVLDISNWVAVLPTSQSQSDTRRILSIEHEVVAIYTPCNSHF
jgi:hypothetical protein